MEKFYVYSSRCLADVTIAPYIRGEAVKTYLHFSHYQDEAQKAKEKLPPYEVCVEQKQYSFDYENAPLLPPNVVASGYAGCKVCTLGNHRNKTAHFRGFEYFNHVRVVFVGMGPGRDEDEQGEPFVGASGNMIDTLFEESNCIRERILLNLVACRPQDGKGTPKRDDPTFEECTACSLRLWQNLRFLKPNIVIALGRQPAQMFWEKPKAFSLNKLYELQRDKLYIGQMRHPAFLLRDMASGSSREKNDATTFLRELSKFAINLPPYLPREDWRLSGISDKFPFKFIERIVQDAPIPKQEKKEEKVPEVQ